jgi:murein tripeptide amidase MpaA
MRVSDPNGPWKISAEEPRLLQRRDPGESGGTYYRLIEEGLFHNFDGLTMRPRKRKERLDMNRNWPNEWRQEHEQAGAGPFPTSEPEVRAAVEAITQRSNICGAVTFHTYSGVNLRPPSSQPEDSIPAEDLWTYKEIGAKGTEMTGYPAISVYHEFRYHPKEVITGVFDDWMYAHRGVFAWTTEIWSPQRQAGITEYKYTDWGREHDFKDDLAMLKWSDEKLGGKGYLAWREFDHPQLGKVEIGGWDSLYAFRNPPFEFLEKEVAPLADWVLWQAGLSPRLALLRQEVDRLGDGLFRIRIAVQNQGYLPTNVTKTAAEQKLIRGVTAEISCDEDRGGAGSGVPSWLASGALRQEAGQLLGWSHVGASPSPTSTDDLTVFEWVVRGSCRFDILIQHERAGRLAVQIDT